MHKENQSQATSSSIGKKEIVKIGSLGVYAEEPGQVWALILTFLTIFIWFVYINNDLGDLVFRSIFTVIIFTLGTIFIYRLWAYLYKKFWKSIQREISPKQ